MTKELNINGTVYALYEIQDHVLYLKPVKDLVKKDPKKSEDLTIFLIQQIEPQKIKEVGFLNV